MMMHDVWNGTCPYCKQFPYQVAFRKLKHEDNNVGNVQVQGSEGYNANSQPVPTMLTEQKMRTMWKSDMAKNHAIYNE